MNNAVRRRGLLVLLIGLAAAPWHGAAARAWAPPKADKASIRLTIDYNDGVRKVFVLPHQPDMTVLDALKLADRHARGIELQAGGSGSSAYVRKIDDLQNQGGGNNARNWLYWLDGKFAEAGAGDNPMQPGAHAYWKYCEYSPDLEELPPDAEAGS